MKNFTYKLLEDYFSEVFCIIILYRGRYRISRKGGRGLSRVWIFHTWTFCSGTYHAVHGQNVGGQNTGGPNASQNCKGGGDKMGDTYSSLPKINFKGVSPSHNKQWYNCRKDGGKHT